MATKAQRAAVKRYDSEHMAYQTIKVRRQLLDDFKAACAARGDKVNTVLREAMQDYVKATPTVATVDTVDSANDGPATAIPCEISSAIWHSPADENHVVYNRLHCDTALAQSYQLAFDAIMRAKTDSQWATMIDNLIQRVRAHIDADGEERPSQAL